MTSLKTRIIECFGQCLHFVNKAVKNDGPFSKDVGEK